MQRKARLVIAFVSTIVVAGLLYGFVTVPALEEKAELLSYCSSATSEGLGGCNFIYNQGGVGTPITPRSGSDLMKLPLLDARAMLPASGLVIFPLVYVMSGWLASQGKRTEACPRCGGTGTYEKLVGTEFYSYQCSFCDGTGKVS